MKTDEEFVENFRKIYLEEFGEEISREEAYGNFFSLVDMVRIIRPPALQLCEGLENPVYFSIDGGRGNDNLDNRH